MNLNVLAIASLAFFTYTVEPSFAATSSQVVQMTGDQSVQDEATIDATALGMIGGWGEAAMRESLYTFDTNGNVTRTFRYDSNYGGAGNETHYFKQTYRATFDTASAPNHLLLSQGIPDPSNSAYLAKYLTEDDKATTLYCVFENHVSFLNIKCSHNQYPTIFFKQEDRAYRNERLVSYSGWIEIIQTEEPPSNHPRGPSLFRWSFKDGIGQREGVKDNFSFEYLIDASLIPKRLILKITKYSEKPELVGKPVLCIFQDPGLYYHLNLACSQPGAEKFPTQIHVDPRQELQFRGVFNGGHRLVVHKWPQVGGS